MQFLVLLWAYAGGSFAEHAFLLDLTFFQPQVLLDVEYISTTLSVKDEYIHVTLIPAQYI